MRKKRMADSMSLEAAGRLAYIVGNIAYLVTEIGKRVIASHNNYVYFAALILMICIER